MVADTPDEEWQALRASARRPLAGAEHLRGIDNIEHAIGWLDFIQPDVGKWDGVTDCFQVAKWRSRPAKNYCTHGLGSGIGLLDLAQLLAACGGGGFPEMYVNENPLRDHLTVAS